MMRLRISTASPFVRKVRIAAHALGLDQQIEIIPAEVTDEADTLRSENPLGKIPTLILATGESLFDSRVIIEYLDALSPDHAVIPPPGPERWKVLRTQALADGILEAAVTQIYEVRFRPEEKRHPDWVAYQAGKIERALDFFESNPPEITAQPDIGQITLACALGYLDFRFEGSWRTSHPRLVDWITTIEDTMPGFKITRPE